ncbi:hypothetical protein GDO86_007005, partial [Hymenochirus boettgeri]
MWVSYIWLLVGILPAKSYAQPRCTLITPNLLRVESEETIVVDAQGQNGAFNADIHIQDFPQRAVNLVTAKISLDRNNGFLGTAKVTIPSSNLPITTSNKQFVYVTVTSPVCTIDKVILLSYNSGYIFIQTDKTIYTPGSTVFYRIFSMNYKMQPVTKPMIIEFMSPDEIIVGKESIQPQNKSGIASLSYDLPELVSLGVWNISAKYEDSPQQNYTASFEVKEYVLPIMEVVLTPDKNYFYADDPLFGVNIEAKYLYGKSVQGHAFVLFGTKRNNVKRGIAESLTRVQIDDGEGRAELEREKLAKYFPNQNEMLQSTLYVTVTVVTDTGSDLVEAQLENIFIVTSPYKVLFTKTSKYFKPGMPFDVMVFVTNPDGSPANGVGVTVEPGPLDGITTDDGTTRLTVNTASNINSLSVTVTTADPSLPPQRQASATMMATAYRPLFGNYLHIGISGSNIKSGGTIQVNFNIRNSNPKVQDQIQHFTYLIMSRGKIITVSRQLRQFGQPVV